MKTNQKGFSVVELLLIIVVVIGLAGIGYFMWNNQKKADTKNTDSLASTSEATTLPPAKDGVITGDVSFPSSGIPADEQACAVSVTDSSKVLCDKVGERQPANNCPLGAEGCVPEKAVTKYSLTVPAGDYYVYSTAEQRLPGYRAYYNEFSKCGNNVKCSVEGHKQYIKVTVDAGATVDGIDPTDWYAN